MPIELKYWILKPRSKFVGDKFAMASRLAMIEYARAIRKTDRELSNALFAWVDREQTRDEKLTTEK